MVRRYRLAALRERLETQRGCERDFTKHEMTWYDMIVFSRGWGAADRASLSAEIEQWDR